MRVLNYMTLPVIYSENFYDMLKSYQRYSKFAYVKDVLVGAISCKEDIVENGERVCYIMTITVLEPYKRYGIASQLLQQAISDCMKERKVSKMTLHVQSTNKAALKFYEKNGFDVKEHLEDYYTDLEVKDCYVLEKMIKVDEEKKE